MLVWCVVACGGGGFWGMVPVRESWCDSLLIAVCVFVGVYVGMRAVGYVE